MLLADAEWNGDTASELHCVSVLEYGGTTVERLVGLKEFKEFVKDTNPQHWVFHAGLTADVPVINGIAGEQLIDPYFVTDTFVASRLFNYKKFNTHSLKELGEFLGTYKGDYDGGWDEYTEEMGEYCDQDVKVLESIVKFYLFQLQDPDWQEALTVEHEVAMLCQDMHENGFLFDADKAIHLLGGVKREMAELEDSFEKAFPPELHEIKRLKYRKTKDGKLFKTVVNAMSEYPKTTVDGDELVVYDWKHFNPGSPQDRIDILWDAGWKPFDKTKGHIKKLKELRSGRR